MGQYILGGAALALGMGMVIKVDFFLQSFGSISWAEEHLRGGSRLGWQLLGLIFIFLGLLGVTGQLTGIAGGIVGKLFGAK